VSGIRGEIEAIGLANVLQLLSFLPGEGYLTLRRGPQRKVLHVSPRGLRVAVGARLGRPLGDLLVRMGRVNSEDLPWFLAMHRSMGLPLGEVLARSGFVEAKEIERILRERVLEHVYELFTWTDATFDYVRAEDGQVIEDEGPLASFAIEFDPLSLMLEATRRADELERFRSVIPDAKSVPEPGDGLLPRDADLDPLLLKEVISLVDGRRTVDAIVAESIFPRFPVLQALFALAVGGAVTVRAAGGLPAPAGP